MSATRFCNSELLMVLNHDFTGHISFLFSSWQLQSTSSSSPMHVINYNHNWSATKQCLHLQSVSRISCHSALSGYRIQQFGTSSGSRHKDTDQCLEVAIFFCRHRSVPFLCENGSIETTVAEGGRNLVARLWGHTLGESWPSEPTSKYWRNNIILKN